MGTNGSRGISWVAVVAGLLLGALLAMGMGVALGLARPERASVLKTWWR